MLALFQVTTKSLVQIGLLSPQSLIYQCFVRKVAKGIADGGPNLSLTHNRTLIMGGEPIHLFRRVYNI